MNNGGYKMKLCETEKCTGCGACFNSCPKQCISMRESDNGYKYPVINQEICIDCGLCSKNCPILTSYKKNYPITLFSAIYKSDDAALLNSSSGGIAYALSEYLLNSGGIVFGAAYDDNMNVKHIEIQDKKDLYKLQGSKYVQSDTGNTFSKVKGCLSDGKKVIFFGLPCQISGLYSYLGSFNTENLYTCDLLCGGAPSPGVFKKYINYLEQKYKSKAENLNFRSKNIITVICCIN